MSTKVSLEVTEARSAPDQAFTRTAKRKSSVLQLDSVHERTGRPPEYLGQSFQIHHEHASNPRNLSCWNSQGETSSAAAEMAYDFDLYRHCTVQMAPEKSKEQCKAMIEGLSPTVRSYLMDRFWTYHNSCIPIVHKEIFMADMIHGLDDFYSPCLHLAMLAMGLCITDQHSQEIQHLLLSHRDSVLQHELRRHTIAFTSPHQDITQVQALMILATLEHHRGRNLDARLYLDTAMSALADMNHNQRHLSLDVSDDYIIVQRQTDRACQIIDVTWTLFCDGADGPPQLPQNTSSRWSMEMLQPRALRTNAQTFGAKTDLESQIFHSHFALSKIAKTIFAEMVGRKSYDSSGDSGASLRHNDHRLKSWSDRIPEALKWNDMNAESRPSSFFLLHLKFHSILILLNRPFAKQNLTSMGVDDADISLRRKANVFGDICFSNAIQISTVLVAYQKRFECQNIHTDAVLHAALAASILTVSVFYRSVPHAQAEAVNCLRTLNDFSKGMDAICEPAARISLTLSTYLTSISALSIPKPSHTSLTGLDQRNSLPRNSSIPSGMVSDDCVQTSPYQHNESRRASSEESTWWSQFVSEGNPTQLYGSNQLGINYEKDNTTSDREEAEGTLRNAGQHNDQSTYEPEQADEWPPHTTSKQINTTLPDRAEHDIRNGTARRSDSRQPHPQTPKSYVYVSDGNLDPGPERNEDDEVNVDWSETFKTLGAVNKEAASRESNGNGFGDVYGCVFKI